MRGNKGQVVFGSGGDWNAPDGAMAEWEPKRMDADPPSALVNQMDQATAEILMACGVSLAVFKSCDGTALREELRQFLFSTVALLGHLVQHELVQKLDTPDLEIGCHELRAIDKSGRARAFQSLVGGGMEVQQAATLSGVLAPDT